MKVIDDSTEEAQNQQPVTANAVSVNTITNSALYQTALEVSNRIPKVMTVDEMIEHSNNRENVGIKPHEDLEIDCGMVIEEVAVKK